MRLPSLDKALRDARLPYTTFRHPPRVHGAREAAVSHVPGRSWAKIVACFADDELVLAVVPAPYMVELEELRLLSGARSLRLAREHEFAALDSVREPGAIPPFGTRCSHRVFVDRSLVGEMEMVINAGTHTDAIRMHYGDFAVLDATHCRDLRASGQGRTSVKTVKMIIGNRDTVTVYFSASVLAATRAMVAEHQIGAVPIVEAGRLVGVFTERDVMARVVAAETMPRRHPSPR